MPACWTSTPLYCFLCTSHKTTHLQTRSLKCFKNISTINFFTWKIYGDYPCIKLQLMPSFIIQHFLSNCMEKYSILNHPDTHLTSSYDLWKTSAYAHKKLDKHVVIKVDNNKQLHSHTCYHININNNNNNNTHLYTAITLQAVFNSDRLS